MARKKNFAIIGIGAFGNAVAKELFSKKSIVTVIDSNERLVSNFISQFPNADSIIMDTTISKALTSYGIKNFDAVILTISSELESSILTVIALKEAGVKNIIAKARDSRHAKILEQLGVKNIILRDEISGQITAMKAMFGINTNIHLVDDNFVALEVIVENVDFDGKSLGENNLWNIPNFNITHITRDKKVELAKEESKILIGDKLFIISKVEKINDIQDYFKNASSN
ncbi:TrkA family potassium uptake protein [Spiroplasma endosymbiont of Amphibalanus improvisus]|uniref:potassium channel family protein n=1 Tax=Spiroplasma endosymbiont of Amphibalanus improvisus TaxID=3066327 RepID=UPI00313CFE19